MSDTFEISVHGLRKCPCGASPTQLRISKIDNSLALVDAHCCGKWCILFYTRNHSIDSPDCFKLAIDAWNNADRESDKSSVNNKATNVVSINKRLH